MLKKKNLSVILAVVLLCASVLGVLFIGAQAAGTKYYMTVGDADRAWASKVPSDMTFIANYDGIADAVAAAKSGRTWAKGDTLTIYIASSSTATPVQASGTQGRQLFSTYTIFRADNTKLPIEINGDDPSTEENEMYALPFGTPTWDTGVICANDYTFKNLDMSAWGDSSKTLFSGSGNVTFDTVTLRTTATGEKLNIASQLPSQTALTGWNEAKWKANTTESVLDSSFKFINTEYTGSNARLSVRRVTDCINSAGTDSTYTGTFKVYPTMIRNKIIVGENANVADLYILAVNNTSAGTSFEDVVEVDGGRVSVVYGVRGSNNCAGKIVCNVKSGTLANMRMGSQGTGTFTGDVEVNWTGGKIDNYASVYSGTVKGNVYNNIKNQNIVSVTGLAAAKGFGVGFNAAATIQGSLYNNFEGCTLAGTASINGTVSDTLNNTFTDCTLNGDVYFGGNGKALNYVNNLSGTITTTDQYAYCGVKDATISGTVTNNIACNWVYSGSVKEHYLMGGSANGNITGKITNNILPGAKIDHDFIGGSNNGEVSSIENYIKGGEVQHFLGGNSFNNTTDLASIKNVLTGGVVGIFRGASGNYAAADNFAVVSKVENFLGEELEDGTYSGDAYVQTYWGGSYDKSIRIGEIENTFYSGKLGLADRIGNWWNSYTAYGGSKFGIVGAIRNTFYGGTFNTAYYYGGNGASAAFGSDGGYTLGADESQVTNYVYGGHFARFAGGSNGGAISTIKNYVSGSAEGSISTRSGAFYCGHGASENTTVENVITGFAPVVVGDDGLITEDTNMKGVIVGGTNNGEGGIVGVVNTVIKNDAVIGTFFGGCNGGYALQIKTTVTKDAGSEAEPDITTYYGNSKSSYDNGEKEISIINNMEAGFVKNYYAGNQDATMKSSITSLVNNLKGGKIHCFYGGNHQKTEAVTDETTGETTTNYIAAPITTVTNNVSAGSTIHVGSFYGAGKTGTVGTVKNNFKSSTASFGVAYGGLWGIDSYKRPTEGGIATNITNVITAGNFEVFTGGSRRAKSGKITNAVTGGTFGEFYGANNQASQEYVSANATDFAVYTEFQNVTVNGNVYGGSYFGDITGNIKTVFTSGTFNGNTFTGNRFGNITGDVTGTVNDGTFNRYFGGSDALDVYGRSHYTTRTETLEDGTKKTVNVTVITGNVNNYLNGGTFTGAKPSQDSAANDFALILGGNYGDIVGSVTNNLNGANVSTGKMTLGGGFMNNITAAGSNGYAISTNINTGTFYTFWGGSYRNDTANSYKVTGNIINTVNGGTFNTATGSTAYNAFAGSCVNAGHVGNVTNTFKGGTFKGYVNGGMYLVDSSTYGSKNFCKGQVTSTISSGFSGSFSTTFYVCGRYGAYYNAAGTSVLKATLTKNGASVTTSAKNTSSVTTGTVK